MGTSKGDVGFLFRVGKLWEGRGKVIENMGWAIQISWLGIPLVWMWTGGQQPYLFVLCIQVGEGREQRLGLYLVLPQPPEVVPSLSSLHRWEHSPQEVIFSFFFFA